MEFRRNYFVLRLTIHLGRLDEQYANLKQNEADLEQWVGFPSFLSSHVAPDLRLMV